MKTPKSCMFGVIFSVALASAWTVAAQPAGPSISGNNESPGAVVSGKKRYYNSGQSSTGYTLGRGVQRGTEDNGDNGGPSTQGPINHGTGDYNPIAPGIGATAKPKTGLTLNKNIHVAEHGVAGHQSLSVHPTVHVSIPHPTVSVHPR